MEEKYVELNSFLKIKNVRTTGGQAKLLIRSGAVLVNGVVETRNKKKLRRGDNVRVEDKMFVVEEGVLGKSANSSIVLF